MLCSLPLELLDLIVDDLRDESTALKACCVVSKSWIPRTRKHLFVHIKLHARSSHIKSWKETFPDPSNSPAHYTRSLYICGIPIITPADTDASGWIRTFHGVVHLHLECLSSTDRKASLVPFYGLSPTVRSLRLTSAFSDVFDLVCSFPLLEDLALAYLQKRSNGGWITPSTSPKLTGSLDVRTFDRICSTMRQLLDLPGGLHFTKIAVSCPDGDFEPARNLVLRCSVTLESLTIRCFSAGKFRNTPLDLSTAMKLKDLTFQCSGSDVRWVTITLQTAKSKDLQKITLRPDAITSVNMIYGRAYEKWQDLDCLLVQFWTSYLICLQVMYGLGTGEKDTRDRTLHLLLKLTRGRLVDLVEAPSSRIDGMIL